MKNVLRISTVILVVSLVSFAGCSAPVATKKPEAAKKDSHDHDGSEHDDHDHDHDHDDHDHDHDHDHEDAPEGIAIPAAVRDNLGITFAKVEKREVAGVRRLPGQFELLPSARQEHRAILSGRVRLAVTEFQSVAPGDLLFTIDSPQWRQIQHDAVEAEGDIIRAEAALDVARAHRQETTASLARQRERIQNLSAVNVRKAELEAEAAALANSLPRLDAEVRAQESALREAEEHYASRLKMLASVTGIPIAELRARTGAEAAWRGIAALQVRSEHAGVVESLLVNNGGWLEEGELALTTLDASQVRFRAAAPQGDIALFHDGQAAVIFPPLGGQTAALEGLPATITLGLTVQDRDRTIALYATPSGAAPWARAGVAAQLEVRLGADAPAALAIPVAAVIQDGLESIFFRRNPKNPDSVLRAVADLGPSDGRWVVLRSGVREGDEVVLDGVYALKLAGATQQTPDGYHYHADGSLHKDH